MKLDPEGVEKAKRAIYRCGGIGLVSSDRYAFAALTAYFDHLKSEGLMREAMGYRVDGDGEWSAMTTFPSIKPLNGFSSCIIRTDKD